MDNKTYTTNEVLQYMALASEATLEGVEEGLKEGFKQGRKSNVLLSVVVSGLTVAAVTLYEKHKKKKKSEKEDAQIEEA